MTETERTFSGSSSSQQHETELPMTDYDKEIVRLVAQGCRNCDIAKRLSVDELAVENELGRIFDKLAVSNRFELVLYAVHHQLMDQSDPPTPSLESESPTSR